MLPAWLNGMGPEERYLLRISPVPYFNACPPPIIQQPAGT